MFSPNFYKKNTFFLVFYENNVYFCEKLDIYVLETMFQTNNKNY